MPYLGWWIEGQAGRGIASRYVWYASEDKDRDFAQFSVSISARYGYEEAMEAGLALTKGMIFLCSWRDGEEREVALPLVQRTRSTREIADAILRGLYRLYEGGFAKSDAPIDMAGAAAELGTARELFMRSVERLVHDGHVQGAGDFSFTNWPTGNIWLTPAGATYVEEKLLAPPARERNEVMKEQVEVEKATDPASVAVVHGRDVRLSKDMFTFLRALHLRPIEWGAAIKRVGKGAPYVGEVVDALFRDTQAVVVLLTGDDLAQLRPELRRKSDRGEDAARPQPRPNVLFEAGIAFGRMPERTILVQVGEIREISDLAGRHVVHLVDATSRHDLANRLEAAGCPVDRSGSDWLTSGTFRGTARRTQKSAYEDHGLVVL